MLNYFFYAKEMGLSEEYGFYGFLLFFTWVKEVAWLTGLEGFGGYW